MLDLVFKAAECCDVIKSTDNEVITEDTMKTSKLLKTENQEQRNEVTSIDDVINEFDLELSDCDDVITFKDDVINVNNSATNIDDFINDVITNQSCHGNVIETFKGFQNPRSESLKVKPFTVE